MKIKAKIFLIITLLLVIFSSIIMFNDSIRNSLFRAKYSKVLNQTQGGFYRKTKINDYYVLKKGIVLVSATDYFYLDDNYIMAPDVGLTKSLNFISNPEERVNTDYSKVRLYDLRQGNSREIDLKKLLTQYSKDIHWSGAVVLVKGLADQKEYLRIKTKILQKDKNVLDIPAQFLFIDIESLKIAKGISSTESRQSSLSAVFNSKVSNILEKMKKYGIEYEKGIYRRISFTKPEHYKDIRFLKDDTQARKVIEGGAKLYISDTSKSNELAKLLAVGDETDIFQGVTIYGAYTKDGKDHIVQSYEEAMEWYQEPVVNKGGQNE